MIKKYTNGEITVQWTSDLCIHSGICARNLSSVFDPKARPWINMDGASTEKIIAQVNQCPSGALSILKEINMSDTTDPQISVDVLKDGPMKVCGPVKLTLIDGTQQVLEKDIFLCRCGHSQNKPFCDGSHGREGFIG